MSELQPKHYKLSQKEALELLERFNISLVQLPKIKKSDPALQKSECEVGDVFKIERKIKEGIEVYYRVVI
jgi:DNA-directed RNA polymerase subunit H